MQAKAAWKFRLHKWGYKPVFCSVESKHGLDSLAFILRDQMSVIVGPSGVGKSSLINALRSNHHASDAAEGESLFDPVGFNHSLRSFFFCFYDCVRVSLVLISPLFSVLISDFRQQMVWGPACWTGFNKKWQREAHYTQCLVASIV